MIHLLVLRLLFSFLVKLNSYHSYTFTSPFQQTLKEKHSASHDCYSVKNILKVLAFKWLLNELLLGIEWSEVTLIWWFASIKFIKSFLKFSFLIFKLFSFQFQFHWKNCPFFIYRYHYSSTILFFFCLFPQKDIIFFFCPFFNSLNAKVAIIKKP